MAKNHDIHPLFFLMMSSYDSVSSISQNIFFLPILPLSNENKSLRTERCSIMDRTSYVTSNAAWGVLGSFKRSRTKGICPLSREMGFGRAKLAIEFSKLSFICKQSKKHAGGRDTVTSGAHDFPGSARSCHALYYPPLCRGRAWNKGMVSGEL